MKSRVVLAIVALAAAAPAYAGMFDDEEARRQIADVRRQVEAQAKTLARIESEVTDKKALLELVNQIEALKGEIASLRGQLEVAANKVDGLDKRQKDLYVDLDTRLRKFETARAETEKTQAAAAAEQQAYEAGLNQFKANNYGSAIQSLQSFLGSLPAEPARAVGAVLDRQRALRAPRLQERDCRAAEADRHVARQRRRRRTRCSTSHRARPRRAT